MTIRFCPQCHSEVEDTGGFCLLGHSLRAVASQRGSLTALRAEVDQAFEDARVKVSGVLSEASNAPPSPPPPRTAYPVIEEVWEGPDPIADFAPAPRMDWGPERHRLLKRLGTRFPIDGAPNADRGF